VTSAPMHAPDGIRPRTGVAPIVSCSTTDAHDRRSPRDDQYACLGRRFGGVVATAIVKNQYPLLAVLAEHRVNHVRVSCGEAAGRKVIPLIGSQAFAIGEDAHLR
jgi:hypothetical protein